MTVELVASVSESGKDVFVTQTWKLVEKVRRLKNSFAKKSISF